MLKKGLGFWGFRIRGVYLILRRGGLGFGVLGLGFRSSEATPTNPPDLTCLAVDVSLCRPLVRALCVDGRPLLPKAQHPVNDDL